MRNDRVIQLSGASTIGPGTVVSCAPVGPCRRPSAMVSVQPAGHGLVRAACRPRPRPRRTGGRPCRLFTLLPELAARGSRVVDPGACFPGRSAWAEPSADRSRRRTMLRGVRIRHIGTPRYALRQVVTWSVYRRAEAACRLTAVIAAAARTAATAAATPPPQAWPCPGRTSPAWTSTSRSSEARA
jgi:hypothetical protein